MVQHNGEATLLIPPKRIFPSTPAFRESIRSSSTVQYQRPFRWQRHFNLADVRSTQVRLSSYPATSTRATSSESSGVPGISYLSGKAFKWLGVQILNGVVGRLVVFCRRHIINGLINPLKPAPCQDRAQWLLKRERTVSRVVEDLLELST